MTNQVESRSQWLSSEPKKKKRDRSTDFGDLLLALTCGDKEDPGAEENIVCLVVDAAHANAQPTEHQQAGAEDGEHAGGTDNTCKTGLLSL